MLLSDMTFYNQRIILNNTINNKSINISFDTWWDLYDKKVGSKSKLESKWNKLTDDQRTQAIKHTKEYKIAQPDKQYRKNPDTYLNNESWKGSRYMAVCTFTIT